MQANTYPLQDILKPERRYVIPTFQRDYEWTRAGQWQLLFEDLEAVADKLIEVRTSGATGMALSTKEQSVSPHFMGAIVCAALPFATGGIALRSVIDGQQRLTTIQLLIRGLRDCLLAANSPRTKDIGRMIFNPEDVVNSPIELDKLWPRRRDREMWPEVMADELPVDNEEQKHLYFEARKYFAESCRAYAEENDGLAILDRLHALVDAIMSLFKLVVIDLEENDDAQVIFEVLNGRQTPLSATDLVKNLLFLRSELSDENVDALYETHWARFDDPWWKEEVGRGHAARGRRDVLLSVWLTVVKGVEANVGHLYREARVYLESGPTTQELLEGISRLAQAYREIYLPAESERPLISAAYGRIASFEITTAIPLFAWLRTLDAQIVSPLDHEVAVRAVESWAIRRSFVGAQTRGYGTHLSRVLREAQLAASKDKSVAAAVIHGLRGWVLDWPTDDEVREAFLTRKFYNSVARTRIRMLLGAIDSKMRTENVNEPPAEIAYDGLEIEHVMPQGWQAHWPLLSEAPPYAAGDEAASRRNLAVDRIGNLTLVTSSFNKDLSNSGWSDKKSEFMKQHSLLINAAISQCAHWDEMAIDRRALELFEHTRKIWPSADSLLAEIVDD
jgi:hypothetical protein